MDTPGNWTSYSFSRPPRGILCEFYRDTWGQTLVDFPESIPVETNVNGLQWRLTGIGRAKLEAMHPMIRVQTEVSGFLDLGLMFGDPGSIVAILIGDACTSR